MKPKKEDENRPLPKTIHVTREGGGGAEDVWYLGKEDLEDVDIERGEEKIIGVYKLDSVVISQVQVVSRPKVT
jgi:hypothetical protein